jgi:hypothetical protein
MGLASMTIKSGGTVGTTGGTDKVFSSDGQTVPGGIHLIVPATADFRVREDITARGNPPSLGNDGKYTKGKRLMTLTRPAALADGTYVRNTIKIELNVHPEMDDAFVTETLSLGAQLLSDSDATSFWKTGATT